MSTTPRRKHRLEPIALDERPTFASASAPARGRAPTGRFESKYRPEFCQAVIEHMAQGASFTSFAASIGVSPRTLHEWAAEHEQFREAHDQAFAKAQAWWEREIRHGLFDEVISEGQGKDRVTTSRRLNSNAARLVMMNLFNWSDKQAQEVLERRPSLEESGFAPYSEWESADLRALNALLEKYRRKSVPAAPTMEATDKPMPPKRGAPGDEGSDMLR